MSHRMHKGDADTFFLDQNCHPQTRAVVEQRAEPLGIAVEVGDPHTAQFGAQHFGALFYYPGSDGKVEDLEPMIARAKADAKAVAQELRDRNEAELSDMKQRATRDLDAAKRAAITELHAEAATLAADIAARILKREISPEDQKRLVDESLQEMAGVGED